MYKKIYPITIISKILKILSCLVLIQLVRFTPIQSNFIPTFLDNGLSIHEIAGNKFFTFYDEFHYTSMGVLGLFPYLFAMVAGQLGLFYVIQISKEVNYLSLKKKGIQYANFFIFFGSFVFSSDYILENLDSKIFINAFTYTYLKEEFIILVSIIVGSLITVFLIREITKEGWGSGISILLCFDGMSGISGTPLNSVLVQALNNNSNVDVFLKTSFTSENLQNLCFYFGFLFLINFLNKIDMYLPYQIYELRNLEFENLRLGDRYIPLRVSIVGIGTFVFVLDVILENVFGVSIGKMFETVEGGVFLEMFDLIINAICSFILGLLIMVASGLLYMQRINLTQFTKVLKQNSVVLCKYVAKEWELVFPGEPTQMYLAQAAWNKGVTKITFYIALVIGCVYLMGGLLCGLKDINWSLLILLGGSINDVIISVSNFYGNRKIR
jgi:preprotein translocase subunit SecY